MVKAPVVITLATALPETVPNRPLVMTATLASPPLVWPARASAKSMNSWPAPLRSTNAPNQMNSITQVADTDSGMPKLPSVVSYSGSVIMAGGCLPSVSP